jgi:hypothetical protein
MDPGEQEEIRKKASVPLDGRSVMVEPSRIIKGIHVIKEPGDAF